MAEQEPQQTASAPTTVEPRVVAIGVDGSPCSTEAFKFYTENVRKDGDKVVLIHAVEVNDVLHSTQWYNSPYSFDRNVLVQLLEEEKDKIRTKLEGYAKLLRDAGYDGTVKSIHAESPGSGIIRASEEVSASIIIVGCRGLGKIRRTVMGSVSDYVIHHSHVPVLVCRHDGHDDKHHGHKHHDEKHTEQKQH